MLVDLLQSISLALLGTAFLVHLLWHYLRGR
jgi:hypothetical protein